MKKLLNIFIALALVVSFTGCSEWLDVNTDPDSPNSESATVNNRLAWCQYYYSYAYGSAAVRGNAAAQMVLTTSRTGALGYLADWNTAQGCSTTPYQNFFLGAACNIPYLLKKAEAEGAYHYMGAALVVKSMGFIMMVDLFGEMPYSDAVSASYAPEYDNGKDIYDGCIADLDKAIGYFQMQQEAGATPLASGDTWCNGDVNKWIKFAYGLKARWLNNLTKTKEYDPNAVLDALAKSISSNAENVYISHQNVETAGTCFTVGDAYGPNVIWDTMSWGTGQRLSKWYVDLVTNFKGTGVLDPRADKLLPSAMYHVVLNADKTAIVSHEWIRDEGVNLLTIDEGWKVNRRVAGNNNSYLAIAMKDEAKEYAVDAILNYYTSVDAFVAAARKYYNENDATIEVGSDKVTITYHAGAMYVNDKDPRYVEDIKNVQLRADAIFETSGLAANDENCYYSAASATTRALGYVQGTGSFYGRPTSDTDLFTYAEACFIKAEVYFRQGDAAKAYAEYQNGIKAHFERMNIKLTSWEAAGYCKTARGFDVSFAYAPIPQADIDAYMRSAAVAQSSGALTLSDIMMQKYIAMGPSMVNYNDMRRYNFFAGNIGSYGVIYTELARPAYFTGSSATLSDDPQSDLYYPRRWQQSSHETNYNATHVGESLAQYSDILGTDASTGLPAPLDHKIYSIPVWWDWTNPRN